MPLVTARDVTVAYGRVPALEDVDFCVNKGDFVGVVGPSGCGKTTLLRLIVGAVSPRKGLVERRPGLRFGYVPQVGAVNWSFPLTVAECVLMGVRRRRLAPWASTAERDAVEVVLARIGLAGLQDRSIGALSGGQQQRVFLARALVDNPEVLLLDEPTSSVDVRTRHEILHLLGEIQSSGVAVVVTTHDLNGIASHLPRLVCLNRRVIADGTPEYVLTPQVLEATYGAPMDVLEHGGMRVVVDQLADIVELRRYAR